MTWEPELDELRRREALAEQLGGDDKVARQHHFGKLTVRERIDRIVDAGSFWEIGKTAGVARYDEHGELVEFTPSNFVYGIAELDGRPAVVSGDDFTVRGGSNDASISAKREASEAVAVEMRLPHVRLLDGMSGGGSVKTIEQAGRTYIPVLPGWHMVVDHLDIAPSISLVLGSVAGFGAARAVASHYSVMVRGTSQMMIAGPALVEQAGLGNVSKEELGHADIHTANGAIDDAVDSEAEAFERALQFLSYLPSSVDELPPLEDWGDDPGRRDDWLLDVVPRNPRRSYDMRAILERVVDAGTFFEIGRGLGHLDRRWPGAARRCARGRLRREPDDVRRRLDRRLVPQAHPADRSGVAVQVADRPLRGLPRFPDRHRVRTRRNRALRHDGAGGAPPGAGPVLHGGDPQGVRHRGCRQPQARERVDAPGLAVGRLGLAAARGRTRGRLQGRSRSQRRPRRPQGTRSPSGSTGSARHIGRPSSTRSNRSSTPATPGPCCATGCVSHVARCGRPHRRGVTAREGWSFSARRRSGVV